VKLTTVPVKEAYFAGWSGACKSTGSCTLIMTANKSVTATFNGYRLPLIGVSPYAKKHYVSHTRDGLDRSPEADRTARTSGACYLNQLP
jgi:hypothetical protein